MVDTLWCVPELFGRPIRENKIAENWPFAEFKHLEETNYMLYIISLVSLLYRIVGFFRGT